jgi:hypothetical protein
VAICVKFTPSTDRSTLNPVSLVELSVHDRSIDDELTAVADRLDGAAGPEAGVLAVAVFEYSESPAELVARTRYVQVVPELAVVSLYLFTFVATAAIGMKFTPSVDRSIANPVSLVELSVQAKSI